METYPVFLFFLYQKRTKRYYCIVVVDPYFLITSLFISIYLLGKKTYDHSQFQQAIDSLQVSQRDSSPYKKDYPKKDYDDNNDYANKEEASGNPVKKIMKVTAPGRNV